MMQLSTVTHLDLAILLIGQHNVKALLDDAVYIVG